MIYDNIRDTYFNCVPSLFFRIKIMEINTIDNKILEVKINPGTQPGTLMRLKGYGMPYGANGLKGDMLVRLNITIPALSDEEANKTINQLKGTV